MACIDVTLPQASQKAQPLMVVAAAAIIDDHNKILIAKRPAHKPMAGLWEFPGGKLEVGETPERALVRELREELSIETSPACFQPISFVSHSYEGFHLLMPLYALRQWQGTIKAVEHDAIAWVTLAEMKQYPMPPADAPLQTALWDYFR